MTPTIVLAEDEASIAQTVTFVLGQHGFLVKWVMFGKEVLKHEGHVDMYILDVGLPDITGFEVCTEIRKTKDTPILFLTARSEEVERVVGLEIGGDDYVTKPFGPRELVARVKAILRRRGWQPTMVDPSQHETRFAVDEDKAQIRFHRSLLNLTTLEYKILLYFISRPGRVVSREQLMASVWSEPDMSLERTVDVHIKSIRSKLREINAEDDAIVTHRGMGYSLREKA